MNDLLCRSWWMLALRGLVALAFGVTTLLMPAVSLYLLLILFAAYSLLSGAASLAGALQHRRGNDDWWLPLLLGVAGIAAGIVAIARPGLTLYILVLLIGASALVSGVLDVAMAIRLRKSLRKEWLLLLNGFIAILFGVLVFLMPDAGALALAWLISAYALISGVLLLALAWRLRKRPQGERREVLSRRITPDRRAAAAH